MSQCLCACSTKIFHMCKLPSLCSVLHLSENKNREASWSLKTLFVAEDFNECSTSMTLFPSSGCHELYELFSMTFNWIILKMLRCCHLPNQGSPVRFFLSCMFHYLFCIDFLRVIKFLSTYQKLDRLPKLPLSEKKYVCAWWLWWIDLHLVY